MDKAACLLCIVVLEITTGEQVTSEVEVSISTGAGGGCAATLVLSAQ